MTDVLGSICLLVSANEEQFTMFDLLFELVHVGYWVWLRPLREVVLEYIAGSLFNGLFYWN